MLFFNVQCRALLLLKKQQQGKKTGSFSSLWLFALRVVGGKR